MPPTTGGKTMGVMQIIRRTDSPLVADLARNHARGTPKRHEKSAAMIDVCIEINKASLVDLWDNMSPRSDHGTRTNMDINGSATKIAAMNATTFRAGETRRDFMALGIRTSIAEML
jgi:hypothetical protein